MELEGDFSAVRDAVSDTDCVSSCDVVAGRDDEIEKDSALVTVNDVEVVGVSESEPVSSSVSEMLRVINGAVPERDLLFEVLIVALADTVTLCS
jgi:hypothetical protein